jgi:hypothetical protein
MVSGRVVVVSNFPEKLLKRALALREWELTEAPAVLIWRAF